MAKGWPNSFITYPFSGILSGFVIHPYHMSDIYDEVSGVEAKLGLMPIVRNAQTTQTFNSFTERVSGIETGYVRGPHGATDNRITVFDSTTGKLVKQSNLSISSNAISSSDGGAQLNLPPAGSNAQINALTVGLDLNFIGPDGLNITSTTHGVKINAVNTGVLLVTSGPTNEFIAPTTDGQGTLGKAGTQWYRLYAHEIYRDGSLWEPITQLPVTIISGNILPNYSGSIPVYQKSGVNLIGPSNLSIIQDSLIPVTSGSGHIGMYYSYWQSGYFNSMVTNRLVLNGVEYTSIGGTGDVTGPVGSIDNEIPRFDGTTGKTIQSGSRYTISDIGDITPLGIGTQNIGSRTNPLSGIYSNQFATTLISGTGGTLTGVTTIDWGRGTSQILNFVGLASGTYSVNLTGGIPGSAYVLETVQNLSGTCRIAWSPSQTVWQGGASGVMTAASGVKDMFSFFYDGSKYLGAYSSNYF